MPGGDDDGYSAVYGHDRFGCVGGEENATYKFQAAVFTSAWNEEVAAVGV